MAPEIYRATDHLLPFYPSNNPKNPSNSLKNPPNSTKNQNFLKNENVGVPKIIIR